MQEVMGGVIVMLGFILGHVGGHVGGYNIVEVMFGVMLYWEYRGL